MPDLALLLSAASTGERTDVISFLSAFRSASVLVPERDQSPQFAGLPPYPNRPLNILAVRDGQQITVPIFSSAELMERWAGRPLVFRTFPVAELIKLLPEDWWLSLNPADEVRKDFSPWELQRLLGSEEELLEIATELELEFGVEPLTVRKLAADEFPEVKNTLTKLMPDVPEIRDIYLAIEEGRTVEGSAVETLLLGLRLKDLPPASAEGIRTKIKDSVNPLLIGSVQLRVLIGVGFSDLELGVFADFQPEISRLAKPI